MTSQLLGRKSYMNIAVGKDIMLQIKPTKKKKKKKKKKTISKGHIWLGALFVSYVGYEGFPKVMLI